MMTPASKMSFIEYALEIEGIDAEQAKILLLHSEEWGTDTNDEVFINEVLNVIEKYSLSKEIVETGCI